MQHLAKVICGDHVSSKSFEFLADAVDYCNRKGHVSDECSVVEAYQTLTGLEEYVTILSWTNEGIPYAT